MLTIFQILLLLNMGRCTDCHTFEMKTVAVAQNVTLTCARQRLSGTFLFWFRLVSGTFPETLGGTISADLGVRVESRCITAKQEPGTFVLHINETQLSDTAVYYCIHVKGRNMTFSKGIFLRVKGPEPDITAITQDFQSYPVLPGDSVTLQCSVLSDSEHRTCPGGHSVFWFRAGSDETPSLVYAQGNSSDGCERSPEAHSPQKCVYSFSKNVSSSDAGTYYCAVATCGEILFGNGTKLDIEVVSTCEPQDNTVHFLVCTALVVSLIVVAALVHAVVKKSCDCCKADATLQINAATAGRNQQSQQRNEDSLVYYTKL
ncbi:uncharacterized protein LOC131982314 [Centropristis striata]|uniref:uncharacterized protein LOC131982314 n=1 Tax=Centropristis striata TaxID=184440 RepID=UPI0027DF8830|nr:uncharacterized protein LOC131982314 [Centropristis striata]